VIDRECSVRPRICTDDPQCEVEVNIECTEEDKVVKNSHGKYLVSLLFRVTVLMGQLATLGLTDKVIK